jgi:hypothetical protein
LTGLKSFSDDPFDRPKIGNKELLCSELATTGAAPAPDKNAVFRKLLKLVAGEGVEPPTRGL